MQLSNEIVLRPRFRKSILFSATEVLERFEKLGKEKSNFTISRVDGHVFIRIPKAQQHFWSPQLHLEITEDETNGTILKGLFGPSPTVWTLFMFFHFIVAGLFIASGVWLYSSIALHKPFVVPIIVMILLIISWIVLYTLGRLGKKTGEKEMQALYQFMKSSLSDIA